MQNSINVKKKVMDHLGTTKADFYSVVIKINCYYTYRFCKTFINQYYKHLFFLQTY